MQTAVRPHPLPSLLQAEQAQVSLSLLVHHMAPAPQQPGGPDHRGWAASLQPFLCQQGQHWTWHSRCGPTSAEESEGSPRPACWLTRLLSSPVRTGLCCTLLTQAQLRTSGQALQSCFLCIWRPASADAPSCSLPVQDLAFVSCWTWFASARLGNRWHWRLM